MHERAQLLFVSFLILLAGFVAAADSVAVETANEYKFATGDDSRWAAVDYDDSSWLTLPLDHFPKDSLQNIFWSRYTIFVDTTLWNKTLAIRVWQIGALEMYLDGRFVGRIGRVGVDKEEEKPIISDEFPQIRLIIFLPNDDIVDGHSRHILAVRRSCFIFREPLVMNLSPQLRFVIGDPRQFVDEQRKKQSQATAHQMLLIGIFSTFGFIHLMLFFFYRSFKPNLYFAILTLVWAFLSYLRFENYFYTDPHQFIVNLRLTNIAAVAFTLTAVRIVYLLVYAKKPKSFYALLVMGLLIVLVEWKTPDIKASLLLLFMALCMIEILRVIIAVRLKKRALLYENTWLILGGLFPFAVIVILRILPIFSLIPPIWDFITFPLLYYSMLSPAVMMSIFLSSNFANISKNLQKQLVQVRLLSEKTVKQEVERARLQAENERKTRELEEARALQLAMLPEQLPQMQEIELAAFMQTATEVGGDYYDFVLHENGDLSITFGDATGHGMQAGSVVTAAKSLFKSLAGEDEPAAILKRMSPILKEMNFGHLYMALSLAHIRGRSMEISAAGMPFPLVYRAASHTLETLELRGVPLGSFTGFSYDTARVELRENDVLLFMSDGLPEMFNNDNELFGEERCIKVFIESATLSPSEIIDRLVQAGRDWAEGRPQKDDVTFLVIKAKKAM